MGKGQKSWKELFAFSTAVGTFIRVILMFLTIYPHKVSHMLAELRFYTWIWGVYSVFFAGDCCQIPKFKVYLAGA
jgi:uncharacterized membrane protein YdcZ (DUF606 family)